VTVAPERRPLEELERSLRAGEREGALAALSWLAARGLDLDEHAVHGAVRRSILLLAAGGDPRLGLTLDGRAADSLAAELEAALPEDDLRRELERLHGVAAGLSLVGEALTQLLSDSDLARRALACALLAEELDSD
jgi:hypothetical protein